MPLPTLLDRKLPELKALERLMNQLPAQAVTSRLATLSHQGMEFPIDAIVLGSKDKSAPTLGLFGGVHGLERIGSDVVIAYLHNLIQALKWDKTLQARMEQSRIVMVPLINPVGMFHTRRSNGRGVDLMRNSPVRTADTEKPPFLVGGHTYSPLMPWYMGEDVTDVSKMEVESRAVVEFVEREMLPAKLSFALDVHSGFGMRDQLWFPYAFTNKPAPHLPEYLALKQLFDKTYANHFYQVEPQAKNYITHGDLWDYLYVTQQAKNPQNLFVPWTLELGSWMWLKKNPRQFFSVLGAFNPMRPHRVKRVLRRHLTLFDFLHRALLSPESWMQLSAQQRQENLELATRTWYAKS